MSTVDDVLAYVDAAAERFVEEWRAACRIPSVRGGAVLEMADWVVERARPLLDTVELVEAGEAPPSVVGTLAGEGRGRLLLYSHYDVQPAALEDGWTVDPFEAVVRDGALVSRGCADDKADVVGRLQALEAWRAVVGPLPVSVVWLCEGAEESGSLGLPEVIEARRPLLESCDWALWESYLRREDGRPEIGFGCRGLLYVELRLRRLEHDQHSAFATIYRSAPSELVKALASLVHPDGTVAIDGFRDGAVVVPDPELLAEIEAPAERVGCGGTSGLLVGDPRELSRRLIYEPTANIAGIWTGWTGPGPKTVLPAEARARLDFRLVPGQTPEKALRLLRAHLDRRGFGDVEIEVLSASPPASSPLDSRLAEAVTAAAAESFGPPVRHPWVAGSGPVHHVSGTLGIPIVMPPGATRLTSRIHGPDENAAIDDYLDLVRFTVRLFARLGG
ncbi:MAG: M20/M25/M40 family metallo-hydrolase [Mycolicibacterium hassiacum]|uniref:M20/M25/M40 family metallo-hydrolase n=1 Tax=Mycolicibacterium hassiacum TaxID=46351 RepID=UPI0023F799DC|nr:M20/M25/M40 family metallo-hydrolase [Mycolicibacterium hassiacum]MBX5485434.1 M20/M25/M40 family metallo-hydrolase [Mycolicibacterium hassiacum]